MYARAAEVYIKWVIFETHCAGKTTIIVDRDVLLRQHVRSNPTQRENTFVFQQDSAPAHRAKETFQLPHREMPQFIYQRRCGRPPILFWIPLSTASGTECVGPRVHDAHSRTGSVSWRVKLGGWVKENGPTDNSGQSSTERRR